MLHIFSYISTFAAVAVCIPRVTPLVTMPSLFVTQRVIETVVTTVVDTIISVRPVITSYNKNECEKVKYIDN